MAARRPLTAMFAPASAVAAMVVAAALLAMWGERWLDPQGLAIFFVVPIVIAAVRFGFTASLAAAVLSVAALNYLFVEPRYTFVVARSQDAAALALFAVIAGLASAIGARARSARLAASTRERQATVLRDLATQLGAAASADDAARLAIDFAGRATGLAAAMVAADGRAWGARLGPSAIDAARWAMGTKQAFRPGGDAPVDAMWAFWPLRIAGRCEMALGVAAREPLNAAAETMLEQMAAQAALAMARAQEAAAAAAAQMEVERERLKSELLAGVSHDLRTPLASIVLTLESLQKFSSEHSGEIQKELLGLAQAEARKLALMVEELLDASRLGRDASPVHLERVSLREILGGVRDAAPPEQAERIVVEIASEVPDASADRELAIRAISNLVVNALTHGGDGAVRVRGFCLDDRPMLTVSDEGPGLGDDPERLFGGFVRGAQSDGRRPGLGLGLTLARRFLEAQGARLTAGEAPEGGAMFTVAFAAAGGAHGD